MTLKLNPSLINLFKNRVYVMIISDEIIVAQC